VQPWTNSRDGIVLGLYGRTTGSASHRECDRAREQAERGRDNQRVGGEHGFQCPYGVTMLERADQPERFSCHIVHIRSLGHGGDPSTRRLHGAENGERLAFALRRCPSMIQAGIASRSAAAMRADFMAIRRQLVRTPAGTAP